MSETYVIGSDRGQELLLPDSLDEYVDEDNEVRFVDTFVETLDLDVLGFEHSILEDGAGRPSYDPSDLLKLYLYGYLNQVRSSRKLERECRRNTEVMWLMKKLAPDFKTIADFRKDNVDCMKKVFKEFISFLQDLDLFGGELASIDGSKFKAVNATKRNFDAKKLADKLKRIDEKIGRYMRELEEGDGREEVAAEEKALLTKRRVYLEDKLERLRKQTEELRSASKALEKSGQNQVSLTDPESRLMRNNGRFEVCYNVQASVDSKNKLIAHYDVTNEGEDRNQLSKMAKGTKETLGVDDLEVTADKGFSNSLEIKECVDNGITPYVPEQGDGGRYRRTGVPEPTFHNDRFVYSPDKDTYVCPAGNEMRFWRVDSDTAGRVRRIYRTGACNGCPFRNRCTNSKSGRLIRRWEHEVILEEMRERLKREPLKAAVRKELSEHPFGTMKRAFNQAYLLLKGLRKVRGEIGFTMLAYDMRRAINIMGTKSLMVALGQQR
jgi:transposase